IVATVLAVTIGLIVGSVAAFGGRRLLRIGVPRGPGIRIPIPIESLLMRVTDAVLSFPVLLLAIALVALVGPSLPLVVGVIAGVLWTGVARIVHGRML